MKVHKWESFTAFVSVPSWKYVIGLCVSLPHSHFQLPLSSPSLFISPLCPKYNQIRRSFIFRPSSVKKRLWTLRGWGKWQRFRRKQAGKQAQAIGQLLLPKKRGRGKDKAGRPSDSSEIIPLPYVNVLVEEMLLYYFIQWYLIYTM